MNILILSVGTRNKIIQYFKRALNGQGRIIATDMSAAAPAIYEADDYYLVPRITEPSYIECILDICKKEHINGVLSLIDPELSLLAVNKECFSSIGTTVVGSEYDLCERALNKMEMYRWLSSHGFPCARSYDNKDDFFSDIERGKITYPVFIKPICGSASISINKAHNREMVELLFQRQEGLMIQEFLNGQEIGVDCYIDLISGELVDIFTKKKLAMRAGETDKASSFKDARLFETITRFVNESDWRGVIDIDVFEVKGKYYISEVNPRFGGGYPHAYECGCNFMNRIICNLQGQATKSSIGSFDENILMMKYNEVSIRRM